MNAFKKEWSGTIILVAQPAEEPITGAKAMVTDGLQKPDYLQCIPHLHLWAWSSMHRGHVWREPISLMFYLRCGWAWFTTMLTKN